MRAVKQWPAGHPTRDAEQMKRVVVLGRGGAGKSTLAARLGRRTGLPLVELDQVFWSPSLEPTGPAAWVATQRRLAMNDRWIMDGDLGPHDVLAPRLQRADTVVVLDYGLARCGRNAVRRWRESRDFWWWVVTWRHVHRPRLLRDIRRHARAGCELRRIPGA